MLHYRRDMADFDVGAIVPSTRDLLQALTTRKRGLALVPLLDGDDAAARASGLDDAGIAAFACSEAGPSMSLVARATRSIPVIGLLGVVDREQALRARFFGADGVTVEPVADKPSLEALARDVRATRMLPLVQVRDAAQAERAADVAARAVVLRADSVEALLSMASAFDASAVLVAWVPTIDGTGLAALRGRVDAAVVSPSVWDVAAFAELVTELA